MWLVGVVSVFQTEAQSTCIPMQNTLFNLISVRNIYCEKIRHIFS